MLKRSAEVEAWNGLLSQSNRLARFYRGQTGLNDWLASQLNSSLNNNDHALRYAT